MARRLGPRHIDANRCWRRSAAVLHREGRRVTPRAMKKPPRSGGFSRSEPVGDYFWQPSNRVGSPTSGRWQQRRQRPKQPGGGRSSRSGAPTGVNHSRSGGGDRRRSLRGAAGAGQTLLPSCRKRSGQRQQPGKPAGAGLFICVLSEKCRLNTGIRIGRLPAGIESAVGCPSRPDPRAGVQISRDSIT